MSKLDNAVIFSKQYKRIFCPPLTKPMIENHLTRLIQSIGQPLAHKGIVLGHIKMLAKLPNTDFIFFSLTRLDRVDIKLSSTWANKITETWDTIHMDINVLLFGHPYEVLEETVEGAMAVLRQETG